MEDQEFARRMKLLEQKIQLYGADSEEVKAARKKLDEDCEAAASGQGLGTVAPPPDHSAISNLLHKMFATPVNYESPEAQRGTVPNAVVRDVGRYFPFLNRRDQLLHLLQHMKAIIATRENLKKHPTTDDLSKEISFTVCHAISGIGKTTLAIEGPAHLIQKVQAKSKKFQGIEVPEAVASLSRTHLQFRISYADVPLSPQERRLGAEFSIATRVLYIFLQPTRRMHPSYSEWIEDKGEVLAEISLLAVMRFIRSFYADSGELLAILHVDETQKLIEDADSAFFRALLDALYKATIQITA